MGYKEQAEDYIKGYIPKSFMNGKLSGFEYGKRTVDTTTYLMYISTRVASLKSAGVADNILINIWSDACQQVVLSARRNIEIAKDTCSKDKYSFVGELNHTWKEVLHRELNINNAKSINELDEKLLLRKTYTQFLVYISIAIKNCELFPVNDQTRNDIDMLKKECQNVLYDKYGTIKPSIKFLTETELFNECKLKKRYWDYLECYPHGEFSRKAKKEENKKENILVTILWVVLFSIFGFFFYMMFIRRDWKDSLMYIGAGFLVGIVVSLRKKIFKF